ncbi:MAG: hypothetical protein Alis3KO_21170 [Aliiglaciecola sp.]|uniref:Gfo/Idh/MocA family oxidoreductase n=1 Tax=Aliiglaciecola sp. M165 TaxID=2593649 RepID=UPI00117F31E5|nr:Gfo/Idh/MocA family oxidoreductase [Aliiglaciecola sp. M165]TRY30955.1 hypothetical protein FM019_13835 [Aliiglaciecola sp. M165]
MKQILLIGAGQIGSRHLQALALSRHRYKITVVDPSLASLNTARSRLEEIPNHIVTVSFSQKMPVNGLFHLTIIATNANQRFGVYKQLQESNELLAVIFEKVIFQSLEHIDEVETLLATHKTKAWVNCARRSNAQYQHIRRLIKGHSPVTMSVSGNLFGLACNGIHFLDLFAFLIGEHELDGLSQSFDLEYVKTKRQDCYEVFGEMEANIGENKLNIYCSNKQEAQSVRLNIQTKNKRFVIDEVNQKMEQFENNQNFGLPAEFKLQPQSKMTHTIAYQIFTLGTCSLPTYAESAKLHRHYIRAFTDYFETVSPGKFTLCPIS